MKKILRYLKVLSKYKFKLTIIICLGMIQGGLIVASSTLIGQTIDIMATQRSQLLSYLGFILLLSIIQMLVLLLMSHSINQLSFTLAQNIRKSLHIKLNQLPIKYFDQIETGDMLTRFTTDIEAISESMQLVLVTMIPGITTIILLLIMMWQTSQTLMIIIIISTPIIFILTAIVAKLSNQSFVKQQEMVSTLMNQSNEMIQYKELITFFGIEDQIVDSYKDINERLNEIGQKAQFHASITNPLTRFISHMTYLSIGVVGGYLMIHLNDPHLTIGIITSFILYSNQFSKPFIEISGMMSQVQMGFVGANRIDFILKQDDLIIDEGTIELNQCIGQIEFRHVYFSYTKDKTLIEDFNLVVEAGETIAIVGKTGAGKSTIVNLLMRFYELDSGDILIDGISIKSYTLGSLRRAFGMVLQDTWIFNGSVLENLAYGNDQITSQDIIELSKTAHLDTFIQSMSQGYQTQLNDSNDYLSAGQKQLLTIVRAMAHQPAMLILDEATSDVDPLTEKIIQDVFLAIMKEKTSFVIAHRLKTIEQADRIIVMDKGRIIETGTHQTLVHGEGFYKVLYESQFVNVN